MFTPPAGRSDNSGAAGQVALLTTAIALTALLGSLALARFGYLLFHTMAELVSVVVAALIGVIAWYTFRFSHNHFLAFIGAAYPAIALIDLLHTLAYQGMGVFPSDTNLPTQLWIAARAVEAVALVLAPRYLERPLHIGWAFAGFAGAGALLVGLIFAGLFPTMHVAGEGLTPLKVGAEYAIIALVGVAAYRLWRRRLRLDPTILGLISAALLLTATAELLFTFYIDVYDLSNLLGHTAKITSFTLIFLGLVRTTLLEPFRILSRNSTTYDAIPDAILVVDENGLIRQVNRVVEERVGAAQLLGRDSHALFHPVDLAKAHCPVCGAIARGVQRSLELYYPEEQRWRQVTLSAIRGPRGARRGMVQMLRDVTELKQAQTEMQRLNRALRAISASNHALIHAVDEPSLLNEVCRIVVEKGGYRMAWVGFPDESPERRIVPRTWAGEVGDFLDIPFSWGNNPHGQGPAGLAIRTGAAQTLEDLDTDEAYAPWRDAALRLGFAATAALPLVIAGRTEGVLVIYSPERGVFESEELRLLQELADDLAYGLNALRTGSQREAAEEKARYWYRNLADVLKQTVEAVAATVEMRDPYTAGHQRRVADLAVAIGRELKLDEPRLEGLFMAGLIHDIGKLHVPAEILTRPGKLDPLEFNLIKGHPSAGYNLLKDVSFPWPVADIVVQHHERIDGSGYPAGLRGDAILLEARIIAVADTVDAIASHRPYRPALGIDHALEVIEAEAGVTYDAEAVAACVRLFREGRFEWSSAAPGQRPMRSVTSSTPA